MTEIEKLRLLYTEPKKWVSGTFRCPHCGEMFRGISRFCSMKCLVDHCTHPFQGAIAMDNRLLVSWMRFKDATFQLCDRIREHGKEFHTILAITRDGLFPAGIIAHQLGIKRVMTIGVEVYREGLTAGEPKLLFEEPDIVKVVSDVLIVDAIVDHGVTMAFLQKRFGDAPYYASVFVRHPTETHFVNFYAELLNHDFWVTFPWDK